MSGSFGGVQVNQLLQRFIDEFFNRSTLNQIRQEQIRLIISALGDDQLHYWLHTQRLTSAVVSLADCYTPPPHLLTGCHSDGSAWFSLHRPLICMTKMERRSNGWRLAACWPVRPEDFDFKERKKEEPSWGYVFSCLLIPGCDLQQRSDSWESTKL